MTACHANAEIANPIASLMSFLDEHARATEPGADFGAFEIIVRGLFASAEAQLVGRELGRHDVDVPHVVIDGVLHRRAGRNEKRYMTVAGPVVVERTVYRSGENRTVAAMDLRAGVVAGWWTPQAAKLLLSAGLMLTVAI